MAASLDTASLHYTDLHKSVDSEHLADTQIMLKHDESSMFRTHESSVESRKTRKSPQLPQLNPVKRFEKQMNQKLRNYKPVLRNQRKMLNIDAAITTPKELKPMIPSIALSSPKLELSPKPSKAKLKSPHQRRKNPISLSIGTSQELEEKILQLPDLTPTHRFSSSEFTPKNYKANSNLWALAAAKKEQLDGGHRFSKWMRRQTDGKGLRPLFNKFSAPKAKNGMKPVTEEESEQL